MKTIEDIAVAYDRAGDDEHSAGQAYSKARIAREQLETRILHRLHAIHAENLNDDRPAIVSGKYVYVAGDNGNTLRVYRRFEASSLEIDEETPT